MLSKLVQAATITFALHLLMGMGFQPIAHTLVPSTSPILGSVGLTR